MTHYYKARNPIPKSKMAIIAKAIEFFVAGKMIDWIARKFNRTIQCIGAWLSCYYFPYKGDNTVIMVMESKV